MRINTGALKRARLKSAMSLRALASAAGVAHDTVMYIEKGVQEPQPRTVKKLADALGIPLEDLIDWEAEGLDKSAEGELAA